jgi:hypothetical protein
VREVIVVLLIGLIILAGLVAAVWSADEDQRQRERRQRRHEAMRDFDLKRGN